MDKQEIEKKVKEIIADKACCDVSKVGNDTDVVNELECDSLDRVEIVMEVEKEFNISVPDEDYNHCRKTKDFVALVEKHLK